MTVFPHVQLHVNSLQNQISQESTQVNVWFVPPFSWRTLGLAMLFDTFQGSKEFLVLPWHDWIIQHDLWTRSKKCQEGYYRTFKYLHGEPCDSMQWLTQLRVWWLWLLLSTDDVETEALSISSLQPCPDQQNWFLKVLRGKSTMKSSTSSCISWSQ